MKKIILFISIHLMTLNGITQTESTQFAPQNYNDSLKLAQSMINELDYSTLPPILEGYTALNGSDPSNINRDVLLMLQQRYEYITKNRLFNLDVIISDLKMKELTSYSDSLYLVKSAIDDLGFSQIGTVLEKYRFLAHTQPAMVNKDVLVYLEEKNKSFSNEN